jgi:hypothetical protein
LFPEKETELLAKEGLVNNGLLLPLTELWEDTIEGLLIFFISFFTFKVYYNFLRVKNLLD